MQNCKTAPSRNFSTNAKQQHLSVGQPGNKAVQSQSTQGVSGSPKGSVTGFSGGEKSAFIK